MASRYPYVQSPSRLCELLRALPGIGVPARFNQDILKSLGYTSSNDRTFVAALRSMGLIEGGGVPTPLWDRLRTDAPRAVAAGVRNGYADLFGQYPDAQRRDDDALRAFFNANTEVGSAAVAKMVGTFKALCGMADFSEALDPAAGEARSSASPAGVSARPFPPTVLSTVPPATITVNINVTLPAETTGEAYAAFFEALRKHLLDPE